MSDGDLAAMAARGIVAAGAVDGALSPEAGRVVLRGVQVIVLEYITSEQFSAVLAALGEASPIEAWIPVAAKGGTYDEAILSAADGLPGKYRAVKVKAWREQTPRHIESPLS